MWQNAHDTYLEGRVLSADPIELIRLLYQSATRAVENARRHLAAGDIAARARSISHASAVLIELATSLDHKRGGQISANLAQLYDYMLRRLTEANLQQSDSILAEVLGLFATLSEAWDGVKSQGTAAPPAQPEELAAPLASEPARDACSPQPSAPEPAATYGSPWAQPASQEAAYHSSWEQPKSQEAATSYSSWEQPNDQDSSASYQRSWEQPQSQEAPVSYQSSWEQPKVPDVAAPLPASESTPGPWSPAPSPWSPNPGLWAAAAAVQELATAYGYSWEPPASPEPAAPLAGGDSPVPSFQANPWEPVSSEPAPAYAASWAPLPPQETAAGYAAHDWSL